MPFEWSQVGDVWTGMGRHSFCWVWGGGAWGQWL